MRALLDQIPVSLGIRQTQTFLAAAAAVATELILRLVQLVVLQFGVRLAAAVGAEKTTLHLTDILTVAREVLRATYPVLLAARTRER